MTTGDDYWTEDLEAGEIHLHGEPYAARFRLHRERERYDGRDELLPLATRGHRLYLHGEAYVLLPDIVLTLALTGTDPEGSIGRVEGSEYAGVRILPVASAQGWHYPEDGLVMLWECDVPWRYRGKDPNEDPVLGALWGAWERLLLERSPGADRIATPGWEPEYGREAWHRFLEGRGYEPIGDNVWGKAVEPPRARPEPR